MWPKIQRVSLNNFGASGSILTKLIQATCLEAGVIMWVQFLEGPPPKFWDGKKYVQNSARFLQLSTLIANISRTDRHVEGLKKT